MEDNCFSIKFEDEHICVLQDRKSRYIHHSSLLYKRLDELLDKIKLNGYNVDDSRYKKFDNNISKFHIELVRSPNLEELLKNSETLEDTKVCLNKENVSFIGQAFVLDILIFHITIAFITNKKLEKTDHDIIRDLVI